MIEFDKRLVSYSTLLRTAMHYNNGQMWIKIVSDNACELGLYFNSKKYTYTYTFRANECANYVFDQASKKVLSTINYHFNIAKDRLEFIK